MSAVTSPQGPTSGPSVEFRVLGPLEVVYDGISLNLGAPKQRAVLAALLLAEGRAVSVDRLTESLWGDSPPSRAVSSVQAYVSRLRALFEATGSDTVQLVRQAPGYALKTRAVDLVEFRQLTDEASRAVDASSWDDAYRAASRAVGLWRGPLLDDLADEPWVVVEAAHLEESYALCRETLVTSLLGRGRTGEAVTRAQILVEAYPLRERAWWLLIVALHRAGRSPEALDAFQRFTTELDNQLGLQPGPDFTQLQTAILRHDLSMARWPNRPDVEEVESRLEHGEPASRQPAPERSGSATGPAEVRLKIDAGGRARGATVGREAQLSDIGAVVDEVVAGQRRWLLITGPAGIGKTRLVGDAAELAGRRGAQVVSTTCPDDEATPAWWPLRALVTALGGDADEIFRPPVGGDADTLRFTIYQRLSDLLRSAASSRPLMVVIDDAQWLDPSSVRFLNVLSRSPQHLGPIGIVVAARDDEDRSGMGSVIAALAREENTVHVAVPPLDGVAASALVTQLAVVPVPASEVFTLVSRTGGNPLLLTEYARLPPEDRRGGIVPLAARGLLNRRLGHLPEQVLEVLRAAAVIGETFELDLLAEVVSLTLIEVIDRLDAAAAEQIIGPADTGHGYQFQHGLLRDGILAQLSVVRRQALHARTAEALASRAGNQRTLVQRARHLSAALAIVDPAVVVEACAAAARDADDRWDWDTAAQQWGAALTALQIQPGWDLAERDRMLTARLTSLARSGRGQTVLDAVDAALDDAAARGHTATISRLASVLLRTSGAWPWAAFGADPSAVQTRLEDLLPSVAEDPAAHARVLAAVATGNCYAADLAVPARQGRQAATLAEHLDDPDVLADTLIGRVLTFTGTAAHSDEAIALLDRLRGLTHDQAAYDQVLRHSVLTMACFNNGDMTAVQHHLTQGVAGSDHLRLPVIRVQLRWVQATLAQWHGQLDHAAGLVDKAHQLHLQTELYGAGLTYHNAQIAVLWDRGRISTQPDLIPRSSEPLAWGALAAAEVGDRRRGRDLLTRRVADLDADYWYVLAATTLLAHAAADLQDTDSAAALLDRLEPNRRFIASFGQAGSIGPVALATGRLRSLLGDPDGARADLAIAEHYARAGSSPTNLARTRLAQLLLDPPTADRAHTLEGLGATARSLGMQGVAATAHQHSGQDHG